DNNAGLGKRASTRNAHAGGKNLMFRTLSGLEAFAAVGDELSKAAAELGDRNLTLRHEGCEQLRPLSLIAIKAPGLDQIGAGVFVVCIHRALPCSASSEEGSLPQMIFVAALGKIRRACDKTKGLHESNRDAPLRATGRA